MTLDVEGSIELRQERAVAIVTVSRPRKLNALTPKMIADLGDMAQKLERASDVRAVVLSAAGDRAFCVGADINVWSGLQPLDMWRRWVADGHRVFDSWARLRLPVIAAINGPALGGGLELAAVADIRVASHNATFGLPEARIATCPGWSGTQRLVSLLGASTVKYLSFTGMQIDAEHALRLGLIQEITKDETAETRAICLAHEIAMLAPVSVQLNKQLIDAGAGINVGVVLEGMAGALAATTQDAREGLASFRDRRQAIYKGE